MWPRDLTGLDNDTLAQIVSLLDGDSIARLLLCGSRRVSSKILAKNVVKRFNVTLCSVDSTFPSFVSQCAGLTSLDVTLRGSETRLNGLSGSAALFDLPPSLTSLRIAGDFSGVSDARFLSTLSPTLPSLLTLDIPSAIVTVPTVLRLPQTLTWLNVRYLTITRNDPPCILPPNLESFSTDGWSRGTMPVFPTTLKTLHQRSEDSNLDRKAFPAHIENNGELKVFQFDDLLSVVDHFSKIKYLQLKGFQRYDSAIFDCLPSTMTDLELACYMPISLDVSAIVSLPRSLYRLALVYDQGLVWSSELVGPLPSTLRVLTGNFEMGRTACGALPPSLHTLRCLRISHSISISELPKSITCLEVEESIHGSEDVESASPIHLPPALETLTIRLTERQLDRLLNGGLPSTIRRLNVMPKIGTAWHFESLHRLFSKLPHELTSLTIADRRQGEHSLRADALEILFTENPLPRLTSLTLHEFDQCCDHPSRRIGWLKRLPRHLKELSMGEKMTSEELQYLPKTLEYLMPSPLSTYAEWKPGYPKRLCYKMPNQDGSKAKNTTQTAYNNLSPDANQVPSTSSSSSSTGLYRDKYIL